MKDSYPRIVADIGGTNARFGWLGSQHAAMQHVRTLECEQHAGVAQAVQAYLSRAGLPRPVAMAMGVATPVTSDLVKLTNRPSWSFSQTGLREQMELDHLLVLNDFTALALSIPDLPPHELHAIGGGRAVQGQAVALIGPGTGLGVSGLLPCGPSWLPVCGEGGHVTLSPTTPREAAVVQALQQRFGHASGERALSGNGLVWMYEALCALDGQAPEPLDAGEVCTRGLAGDALCAQTLTMFCALLGNLAGNLALTLGARSGVYIGGGIVPRMLDFFECSPFRERFEQKGRMGNYLAEVPTWVICSPVSPALAGAARALDQSLLQAGMANTRGMEC
ncbi:glucokinase [Comamonas composti]|uniref:glucokinase n=1 Tax=Comamonas composti TaxID=408558 RepID=UPI0003F6F1F6|nr:glucokinase [Comamonas composti]